MWNLLTLDKERNARDVNSWFLLKNTRLPVFSVGVSTVLCIFRLSNTGIFLNPKAFVFLT